MRQKIKFLKTYVRNLDIPFEGCGFGPPDTPSILDDYQNFMHVVYAGSIIKRIGGIYAQGTYNINASEEEHIHEGVWSMESLPKE